MVLSPDPPGSARSVITSVGLTCRTTRTPSTPVLASPTTVRSGSMSMSARSPSRRIAWSSTRTMLEVSVMYSHRYRLVAASVPAFLYALSGSSIFPCVDHAAKVNVGLPGWAVHGSHLFEDTRLPYLLCPSGEE